MADYTKISRASLYDSDEHSDHDEYMPNIELDIVEVEPQRIEEEVKQHNEEFEFPLFSFGAPEKNTNEEGKDETKEVRGRSTARTMNVTLREDSVEKVKNERPKEYYFANYSEEMKHQFEVASVDGEEILNQVGLTRPYKDWHSNRIMDLNKHNQIVELQQLPKKSKRPGKSQRMNKIKSTERKVQRQKVYNEIEKQKQRMLKKKMFHKRGGKKHKKKTEEKTD